MWNISLTEIVDQIGDSDFPQLDYEALAQKLNLASEEHSDEIRSFPQAYKVEMAGALSAFMPVARHVLEQMFERATGQKVEISDADRIEHEKKLLVFFSNASQKRKLASRLRTLHITSLCHAAYRWDKKRNLKKNDFLDFYHAAGAVGYCDFFLTENSLQTMLKQNHLNIAESFSCKIISSIEEAAECLAQD